MPNLSNLFKVAPTTASFFTGQQFADDQATSQVNRERTLADIAKMQQDLEFNSKANPLKLEQMGLVNRTTEATLPGIVADSDKKSTDARMARETFDTTRDTTNSTNQLTMMGNHIKQAQQVADVFTNAAMEVQGLPPPLRAARLRQIVASNQMDPNDPNVQQFVVQASENPELLVQRSNAIKTNIAQHLPAYIQALAQTKLQGENSERVANIQANASRDVAKTNADARVEAADLRRQQAEAKAVQIKTFQQAAVLYNEAANKETDPTKKAALQAQAAQYLQAAQTLTFRPGIDAAAAANMPALVSPQPFGPTNPGLGAPDAHLGQALKAAGVPYEPDKYEYRVGPNGNLQRKPKGQ